MWTSIIFLAVFPLMAYGWTNYCKTFGRDHTMCQYKEKGCTKPNFVSGTTAADRADALKAHNDLRNRVASGKQPGQPSATNMKQLVWDTELEKISQRWADQCTFGHDKNQKTVRFQCGQTAAMTMSREKPNQAANFTQAVNMWYDEVTDPGFDPKNINPYKFGYGYGHYAQVVWANTKYLGCGYAFYWEYPYYRKLYMCNYGEIGNWPNGVMYKIGPAASACTSGKSRTYPALCN